MSDFEESAAEAESLAESSGESVRAPRDTWPPAGSLASLLEGEVTLRRRARDKGVITRWPSLQTTGIPSVKAMGLNVKILEIVGEWWAPTQPAPCFVPIQLMRREIKIFRGMVDLKDDGVLLSLDAEGIKKMFSHGIRRLRTGSETKASILRNSTSL